MAHKKGVGSSDNGRDSISKRLGIKLFGGQAARAGNIIVRQRGTKFHAGENVYMGRDHTLHAMVDGTVTYRRTRDDRRFVSILPLAEVPETPVVVTPKPKVKPSPNAPKAEAKPAAKPAAAAKTAAPAPVEAAPVVEPEIVVDVAPEPTINAPEPAIKMVAEAAADVTETTPAADDDWAEVKMEADDEPKAASGAKISTPLGNIKVDDLKIVEGIGPKIEQLLKEGGINTWAELAEAPVERLREILEAAGPRYQIHDPSTWPAQSKFADEGKWDELKEYQDMLIGGRDVKE